MLDELELDDELLEELDDAPDELELVLLEEDELLEDELLEELEDVLLEELDEELLEELEDELLEELELLDEEAFGLVTPLELDELEELLEDELLEDELLEELELLDEELEELLEDELDELVLFGESLGFLEPPLPQAANATLMTATSSGLISRLFMVVIYPPGRFIVRTLQNEFGQGSCALVWR